MNDENGLQKLIYLRTPIHSSSSNDDMEGRVATSDVRDLTPTSHGTVGGSVLDEETSPAPACPVCNDLQQRPGDPTSSSEFLSGFAQRHLRKGTMRPIGIGPGGTMAPWLTGEVPPLPGAATWIRSAIGGCESCQLVVDAISALRPGFFAEYDPMDERSHGLAHKGWQAVVVPGEPLIVVLADASINWAHLRYTVLEIFTPKGTNISSPRELCYAHVDNVKGG
jgi:hypothetical protein